MTYRPPVSVVWFLRVESPSHPPNSTVIASGPRSGLELAGRLADSGSDSLVASGYVHDFEAELADSALAAARAAGFDEAVALCSRLDRLNPFIVSHHTDSVSGRSGSATPAPLRFPAPHDRALFKLECAAWYGLQTKRAGHMIDMYGNCAPVNDVTLAHI
jgi:hypothetical protein